MPKLKFGQKPPPVKQGNPMIGWFGAGPDGVTCADCASLVNYRYDATRSYWKCKKRGISKSVATDHRKSWPACGAFKLQREPVITWLVADFDSTQIWLRRFIDGVQQPDEVVTVFDPHDKWERFNELQSGDCPF